MALRFILLIRHAGSNLTKMNVDASVFRRQQTRAHARFNKMLLVDQTATLGFVVVNNDYFFLILLSGATKPSEPLLHINVQHLGSKAAATARSKLPQLATLS